MIKIIRGSFKNSCTQAEISAFIQAGMINKSKVGIYTSDEDVLIYKNTSGHIISTKPKNSSIKGEVVTVTDYLDSKKDFIEAFNFNNFNIKDVFYTKNKKTLNKIISDFNYEKGM